MTGTWTTPGGGECKEYESGAKICDHPDGSTFVWIVEDWTAWMQHGDGSRETRLSSSDRPPGGGSGGGSSCGGGNGEEIPYDKAQRIAEHAIANGHEIPELGDIQSPQAPLAYQEYVYDVGTKIKPHVFADGTKMFYEQRNDAVVFYDPSASYNEGTAFVPDQGGLRYYLDRIKEGRALPW